MYLSLMFDVMLCFICLLGLQEIENMFSLRAQPKNPFLQSKAETTSLLDVAVDFLTSVTSKRNNRKSKFWFCYLLIVLK